jgi:hypothetical protein
MHLPVPNVSGWMHRAFVLRLQIERALDAWVDATWPDAAVAADTTIVLYNEVDAGLGDVAYVSKLLKLLRARLPQATLVLASTGVAKQERFGRPEGVTLMGVEDFAARDDLRHPTLVISAPGNFDHCRSAPGVLAALKVDPATPFLYLSEYGSLRYLKNDVLKAHVPALEAFLEAYTDELGAAAGADPDALGHRASTGDILHAPEDGPPVAIGSILDGLLADRADNPLRDWVGSPLIAFRPCGLDVGEIGVHVDRALLAEAEALRATQPEPGQALSAARRAKLAALEHGHLRARLEASDPRTALYAGYCTSGYDLFLDYVSILEARGDRDVDLVLPTPRTPEMLRDAFITDSLRDRLASRGVGRVVFHGYDESALVLTDPRCTTLTADVSPDGAGKTLNVISYYPLPHRDMRRLLLASEPPTVVSGDQSFSDAISADKAILYAEPVYCQAWHIDALLALSGRVAPEMQTVIRFGTRSVWSEDGYDAIVEILSRPDALAPFLALAAEVRRSHDANAPLVAAVKRTLLSHADPAVRAAVLDRVTRGNAAFRAVSGWTVDD